LFVYSKQHISLGENAIWWRCLPSFSCCTKIINSYQIIMT
jgi:hypothetical protein